MKKREIDAIAWDWGRVLGIFDDSAMIQALAQHTIKYTITNRDKIGRDLFPLRKLHDAGIITSQQFYKKAVEVAQLDLSYSTFHNAWAQCIRADNPGIVDILRCIRPAVRQCVVSNTDPIHWTAIERLSVMQKFFSNPAILALSFQVGERKPDKKMYDAGLKCLGVSWKKVSRVLYVDDVAEYCVAFAKRGGRALHYNCLEDPLEKLEHTLYELGAL